MRTIYKNTNVDGRKPATSAMTPGEIAVNYNANNPRIMTEDSNGEIASFLPESKINSLFTAINGQLSQAGIDAALNTTDIENLESWMGVPITEDEIIAAFRKKIKFILDGTEYTAFEDMTWEEWVTTDFNVGRKIRVRSSDGKMLYYLSDGGGRGMTLNGLYVYSNQKIQGATYKYNGLNITI